jgi:hypothetical protein
MSYDCWFSRIKLIFAISIHLYALIANPGSKRVLEVQYNYQNLLTINKGQGWKDLPALHVLLPFAINHLIGSFLKISLPGDQR